MMKNTVLLILLIFLEIDFISGQKSFHGSFFMSFKSAGEVDEPPLFWNIMDPEKGGKLVFRVEDEMRKKGVNKRVLFDPSDSTWTMMIGFNQVKQGTRIHTAKMFIDTTKHPDFKIQRSNEEKIIGGFLCNKLILQSNDYTAEVWITKEYKFDLCNIYRLLCHCGMMNEHLRKSNWYLFKKINGMILEVTSTEKQSGKTQSVFISTVKPADIDSAMFNLDGYKIADIPEGQNCGPVMQNEKR